MSYLLLEVLETRCLLSAAFDLIKLTDLRADSAFSDIDGTGFSVVIIDTGLDTNHVDIRDNYLTGRDIANNRSVPAPVHSHGTHVAGIVGSINPEIGVAPDVNLIALQVFTVVPGHRPVASNQSIENALEWVLDNQSRYNIVAVNMSLGSGYYTEPSQVSSSIYADEIDRLEEVGVTVVSASGNGYGFVQTQSGYQNMMFPNSSSPGIISTLDVGAVWETNEGQALFSTTGDLSTGADRITCFSQRPPLSSGNVIFAPGAKIRSTIPGNKYAEMAGTSMAAPMISGTVALMQEAAMKFGGRRLSVTEIRSFMLETADTIYDGDDEDSIAYIDRNGDRIITQDEREEFHTTNLNYKRINVYSAVKKVRSFFNEIAPPPPDGDAGDANGTIRGAHIGPRLDGSPTETFYGIIGQDASSTGTVQVGNTDVDMYQFRVIAAGNVNIEVASNVNDTNDFNSTLRLFNSSGTELAKDYNSGTGNFSKIVKALTPGTYYVGVSGYKNDSYDPNIAGSGSVGDRGNYSLLFSLVNNDPNGLLNGAVAVNLGQGGSPETFNGNIGTDYGNSVGVSDVDIFRVVIPDNGILFVDIDTPYLQNYVDSYLRIFNAQGQELVNNDDGLAFNNNLNYVEYTDYFYPGLVFDNPTDRQNLHGHTSDSFIAGRVAQGDVYYIGVSDYFNDFYDPRNLNNRPDYGSGGLYQISISFYNNDLNGTITQVKDSSYMPLPTNRHKASIKYDSNKSDPDNPREVGNRDVDFYRFRADSSSILEIDIDSYSASDLSDKVDTAVYVFDASGKYLAGINDVNGLDPLLRYEVEAGQDYYVAVVGYGNDNFDPFQLGSGSPGDTGDYYLSASLRSKSIISQLADDRISYSGIQRVFEGNVLNGFIGNDNGLIRGAADVDLYRYVADIHGTVKISTKLLPNISCDTYLRFFDSQGKELAYNDNEFASSLTSSILVDVTKGATYYIGVNGSSVGARNYNPNSGAGAVAGSKGDYRLSIEIESEKPEISIAVTDSVVKEQDQDAGEFTISRTGAITEALTVSYTISGTSDNGTDYQLLTDSVAIPAGSSSAKIAVVPLDDANIEPSETVILSLSSHPSYVLAAVSSQTILIRDNDGIKVSLTPSVHTVLFTEADGTCAQIRIRRAQATIIFVGADIQQQQKSSVVLVSGTNIQVSSIRLSDSDMSSVLYVQARIGGDRRVDLGDITVDGSVGSIIASSANLTGNLTITGTTNRLFLADLPGVGTVSVGKNAGADNQMTVRLKRVKDINFSSLTPIRSFVVTDWQDSDNQNDKIKAPALRSLISVGNRAQTVRGDFNADVELTGQAGVETLGSVRINGGITGGTWQIAGNGRLFQAGSLASSWEAHFSGNLGTLMSKGDAGGDLTVRSLQRFIVHGNYQDANLKLTQAASGTSARNKYALGQLYVMGVIDNVDIRSRNDIGSIRAKRLLDSTIFAGVKDSVTTLPDIKTAFEANARISMLRIQSPRHKNPDWIVNSRISAYQIDRVLLGNAKIDNNGNEFGLSAQHFGSVTYKDANKNIRVRKPADLSKFDNLVDFKVRLISS